MSMFTSVASLNLGASTNAVPNSSACRVEAICPTGRSLLNPWWVEPWVVETDGTVGLSKSQAGRETRHGSNSATCSNMSLTAMAQCVVLSDTWPMSVVLRSQAAARSHSDAAGRHSRRRRRENCCTSTDVETDQTNVAQTVQQTMLGVPRHR